MDEHFTEDGQLWTSVQLGDEAAFARLFRRYEPAALRLATGICGADSADDAVQTAFLSMWKARSGYQPARGSVRNWILGCVRNRAIDVFRSQRSRRPEEAYADMPEPVEPRLTEVEVASRETGRAVRDAVASLPLLQREVIELAYFGERSQTEIASVLRVPLGTVKGRTRLALEKLPDQLDPHRALATAS